MKTRTTCGRNPAYNNGLLFSIKTSWRSLSPTVNRNPLVMATSNGRLCELLFRLCGGEMALPGFACGQHLGLTIGRRTILGKAMSYTSPGVVRHRPLRVGACLSLTGRYRLFGTQAAHGLEVWRGLDGQARLMVEDDGSDPVRLSDCIAGMAPRCDLLLGPYSTELTRAAARLAPQLDGLLWNHGGAGDYVQRACPGRIVSVLTPPSRYAGPFLRHVAQA